jgi:hydroxymethylpyrimidine/phosphomethylpyrimidine kinase
MVMQYLVNRNEEYLHHIELFTQSVEKILERLVILEYNIQEMQVILKNLPIDESKDAKLKEVWYAKQGRKRV